MPFATGYNDGFGLFQDYTKVNMKMLYDAGCKCYVQDTKDSGYAAHDAWQFFKTSYGDQHSMWILLTFQNVGGHLVIYPELHLSVEPSRESAVYNEFTLCVTTNAGTFSGTVTPEQTHYPRFGIHDYHAVTPLASGDGLEMYKAICNSGTNAKFKFGTLDMTSFTPAAIKALKDALDLYTKAGVFDQDLSKIPSDIKCHRLEKVN